MNYSQTHQALIQLFANDYFFFSVIAFCFFFSGIFAGYSIGQYRMLGKHEIYFDHFIESDRILRSELAKLRKKLSESEPKQ